MKTIIFSILIFFVAAANIFAFSDHQLLNVKPKFIIRIVIGAPPPTCTRSGICDITILPGFLRPAPNEVIGMISLSENNQDAFTIEIDRSEGMDASTYRKYFGDGYFVLESDYNVPVELGQKIGIYLPRIIPRGRYAFIEQNGSIILDLPIK